MLIMYSHEVKGQVEGLEGVLEKYQDLFQEATKLPPQRICDHAIVLKEGAQVLNIRPYRYTQQQKEAIEVFVKDMLVAGLVKPSEIAQDPQSHPIFVIMKGCLWYKGRLVLPSKSTRISTIMGEFHACVWGDMLEGLEPLKELRMFSFGET